MKQLPEVGRRRRRITNVLLITSLVGIIVSLLLPAFSPLRTPHRLLNCASNLRQVGLSIKQYAQDHGEAFPPDLRALFPAYAEDRRILVCPLDASAPRGTRERSPDAPWHTSFVYVSGLDDTCPSACVLAYERQENHRRDAMAWWQPGVRRGVNVLFLDTHVEWLVGAGKLEELLERTRTYAAESGREIELMGE